MTLRRVLRGLALVGAVISTVFYGQPSRGAPPARPFDPTAADGRVLTLEGTVEGLDARVSESGNAYFSFDLDTGLGVVRVFRFGKPPCPAGSRATVEGVFHRVKRVGPDTFFDRIDADRVTCP